MSKGVVLSIERKRAVVFTDDCRLVRLPLEPHHAVGKEIRMNPNETVPLPALVAPRARWARIAVAAVLVVVVALGALWVPGLLSTPVYATVSVDVNPSLQLQLDRELRVVAALAMNEDAKPILEGLSLKGLPWSEAVQRWVEAIRTKTELPIQEMLLSAVLPEDAVALRNQLVAMEGEAAQGAFAGIAVRAIYSNDLAVADQAAANGLSVGRQMLLTQSELQERIWTRATIGGADLGELVGTLLRTQDRDMTRYTLRTATGTPAAGSNATPGHQDATPGAGPDNGNGGQVTPGGNGGQATPGQGGQGSGTCTPTCAPTGSQTQGDVTPGGSGNGGGTGGPGTPTCTPTCASTGSQYQGGR